MRRLDPPGSISRPSVCGKNKFGFGFVWRDQGGQGQYLVNQGFYCVIRE